MSRLIIKNLPKNINEEKLRSQFAQKGNITDIQLKYTKDGVFRQFAFIGYENEDQATSAIKYFNNTCIQTSRIIVEPCASLGGDDKPKSWSKYSKDSVAYKKAHGIDEMERQQKEKEWLEMRKNKTNKLEEILGDHKNDPAFIEFMKLHDKNRTLWSNDADIFENDNEKKKLDVKNVNEPTKISKEIKNDKKADYEEDDNDEDTGNEEDNNDNEDDDNDNEEDNDEEESNEKLASKNISDLDYMKSLMEKDDKKTDKKEKPNKTDKTKKSVDLYTIKIHNIPYTVKRQDIFKFFKPIKPFSVRLPVKVRGFCYIGFKNEKDFVKAMLRDKSFIKGKQVFFSDFTEKNKVSKNKLDDYEDNENKPDGNSKNSKWLQQEESLKNEEDISESGKIFFRNLAYTTNDDDLRQLFQNYGEIADISLPIDPLTRKIKGFGTITFIMPEHAVKAFNELDGSTFHGRLLHLIPGKSKEHKEIDENTDGLSFKAKRDLKLKKSAGQSHNWNTLFLGSNAVADILAKKFDTTKETILDTKAGGSSAAVRLALGETQIVMEMKKFLEENDVELNVFETAQIKRSNTIILAKNLPAETTVSDLKPIFSNFGLLGRIVLPPTGVTAIVEYLDPSEAKKAFRKLAYSKFKNLPLYLEWAPENIFKTVVSDDLVKKQNIKVEVITEPSEDIKQEVKENIKEEKENKSEPEDVDDEPPEADTTLFLRNLNFQTREEAVRKHFKKLGPIHIAQVAMRKDPENPKNVISLGYGFIQFKKRASLEKALKTMQFTNIEGKQVELKRSDRTLKLDEKSAKKQAKIKQQTGTKILVRNIPFQAKTKEVYEIFKAFGELRSVRLPKKMTPGEDSHRGFGFVDYITKNDAKKAFEALSNSTHLYGRRLVLEWASTNENDVEEIRKRTAAGFSANDASQPKQFRKATFDEANIAELNVEEDE